VDIKKKGYKKTTDSRDEINETHGRLQFIEHRNNEDMLKEFKSTTSRKEIKNCYIMLAGQKTLDMQNNSLIIDLLKDEDLDDH
jgi:hypothetical protein